LPNLTLRPYREEEDYWRIHEFLRQVMLANNRREWSWHVARLDYWWWFANPDLEKIAPEGVVFIWESRGEQIAAVLNPESRGQAFPQIHPDFRTPGLEAEMIAVAEQRLTKTDKDGRRSLRFWLDSQDTSLQALLAQRGFQRVDQPGQREYQHRRSLDGSLPEASPTPGYTLRSMGDGLELLERCYASGLGFHDDDIHIARDNRDHPAWYHHIQSAPLYRRDLDIVAVASDGSIASFCTVWFDDVSRTAYLEPVATVPAQRQRGLGRAVMVEGLHRLKRMGCEVAFVGGYSQAANALYFSVMGPEHDISEPWEKIF
jgi:GNAT superfamily N-acetyltransferase